MTSSIFLHMLPILQPGDIHKLAGPVTMYHTYIAGAASNYMPDNDDHEWGYYDKYNNFHPTSLSSSHRYLGTCPSK
jgi:hypothetical protein